MVGDHHGVATIDGYTVAHEGGVPRYSTIVATTADRRGSSPATTTPTSPPTMAADEWCGRDVTVEGDRFRVGD